MSGSDQKYSFRNLQPITYLKTFNHMIDKNSRIQIQSSPRHQLKVVPLSKFPIPRYYQEMEGIFQNVARKKSEQHNTRSSNQQIEEEQFVQKHNQFMRKVLTKFIEHNENRQKIYQKEKKFIKRNQNPTNHFRTLSEPKLINKRQPKLDQKNPEAGVESGGRATIGSSVRGDEAEQTAEILDIFPKLKPRKKKEKFSIRQEKNIQELILERKLQISNTPTRKTQHPKHSENQKLDLKEEIVNLQNKQARKQEALTQRIEKQIQKFDREMENQIHAIKYYKFWSDPEESQGKVKRSRNQLGSVGEGRADFAVNFGNYRSN